MRHLDVLVLPSYEEPFGTVLAEAMAVGTPVVATRVGGLAEVVDDGVTGRLVEPGRAGSARRGRARRARPPRRDGRAARERAARFDADRLRRAGRAADRGMKVAFDSRPAKDPRGIGRYARCLLEALRDTDRGEIVETHTTAPAAATCSTRRGSTARCSALPVPMVVTLHDLVPLKRRGEYLRSGLRFKLRYLAVQRAVRVIVPTRGGRRRRDQRARDPRGPDRRSSARRPRRRSTRAADAEVAPCASSYALPGRLPAVGRRPAHARTRASGSRRSPGPSARCRSCSSGQAGRWAHELPGVHADRRRRRRRAGGDLHGRPRARVPVRRRGLRAAAGRGAGLRHAGRRLRRAGAARGARRPRRR